MTTPQHGHTTTGTSQRPGRQLTGPIMAFSLADEVASTKAESVWERSDRNGRTLVEEPGMRVTVSVLKQGAIMNEHVTDSWVSIHVLEGAVTLNAGDEVTLGAGMLATVQPNIPHSVKADAEAVMLLTITKRTV